jgi:hypothetical protein
LPADSKGFSCSVSILFLKPRTISRLPGSPQQKIAAVLESFYCSQRKLLIASE